MMKESISSHPSLPWTWLDRLSIWLTLAVVIIAFLLSFGALRDLAAEVGIVYPTLYPLMIDAGLVIYNIMALQSGLYGQRNRYAWFLIVMATLASVFLNVVHALDELPIWLAGVLGPAMAAIPPLVIFGAFHLVVLRLEAQARRTRTQQTLDALDTAVATRTAELDTLMAAGQQKLVAMRSETDREQRRLADILTDLSQQRAHLQAEIEALVTRHSQLRPAINQNKAGGRNGHTIGRGETAVSAPRTRSSHSQNSSSQERIEQRRQQVRQLLAAGMDKKEIAEVLGVHVRTIKRDMQTLSEGALMSPDLHDDDQDEQDKKEVVSIESE